MKITNKDIYDELGSLKKLTESNFKEHELKILEVNNNLEKLILKIKEKTNLNTKLIIGGYGFSMAILGWLISHIT